MRFTPGGYARYLLTEIDPTDSDRVYGLCDLGLGHPVVTHHGLERSRIPNIPAHPAIRTCRPNSRLFLTHRRTTARLPGILVKI
jgi:hypothetical protein